ncbi:MAG: two-component sensor histidine kinase [Planctomycetes bacterium]|nr:two-component sensor histidine kinase [Planctomycetota bacterium]
MDSIPAILVGALIGAVLASIAAAGSLRRRADRALAAERRAQSAERLAELGSMTSGLAHEIKNPLSTLTLNAQLLREEVLDSELPEPVRATAIKRADALARESSRLKDILSDFLRFAGRIKLDPQPRDLRELVQELADFFHPQAERAGVLLRVDTPSAPAILAIDAGLLKQAILNLIINAVQAMCPEGQAAAGERRGELLLRVEAMPAGRTGEGGYRLDVIDTGPGIEPSRLPTIFRPYASTKPGGSGLGLATTRRIVEEHGGRVEVFSDPSKGTCFSLFLPQNHSSQSLAFKRDGTYSSVT